MNSTKTTTIYTNFFDDPLGVPNQHWPQNDASRLSRKILQMIPVHRPRPLQEAGAWIKSLPLKTMFQRVPALLLLLVGLLCISGPSYFPYLFAFYILLIHVFIVANGIKAAYGAYIGYHEAVKSSMTDWKELYMQKTGTNSLFDTRHDLPFENLLHVVIIPNYKESYGTLGETLEVLASHELALSQYRICLAMEESEAECHEKAQTLIRDFGDKFFEIIYTVHPSNLPGEIRGKSSNVAWAARQMATLNYRHEHEIVTVMDADTCFASDYFLSCTYHYCVASPSERKIMMFAPCTVFDRYGLLNLEMPILFPDWSEPLI
jgi:hypothetical protein